MVITLPWPPSVNRYWRRAGNHTHISNEGRAWRTDAAVSMLRAQRFGESRVSVSIEAYPPDKRRRDLDNVLKAVLDALQTGQIFNDDAQVDDLRIIRREVRQNQGGVVITVGEMK